MNNVRFYRLTSLPNFVIANHQGIFVHLTPSTEETHKAGLWFGGANGWEYLTNDTNPESITNAINALDVDGYAQAEITTATDSSTLTIKGIKEVDGKIGIPENSENLHLDIAIDGVYTESNKIATQSTVNNKIATLDASVFQTVTKSTNGDNTVLTFNGIKEVDGIISQGVTENAETLTVGDAKLNIEIGATTINDVFSANATSNGTIKLDENVFKTNNDNHIISVITPTAVASDNRLVTEKDIANLNGAMHYKKAIASDSQWPTTVKAGDVYIASGNFKHGDGSDVETIESGDLIVFNTDSVNDYTVVQSNITLGTNNGQIAKNDGDLADGKLVVATLNGIRTSNIDGNVFEDENNTRTLSIANNGPENAALYHSVAISDNLKVIGKDFSRTINISSVNSSIKIEKNPTVGTTGVMLDLVWNESIE